MFCNNSTQVQAFPQWATKTENDNSFKTSNSKIFPSLNPLGNFYKQRKTAVVHPNPSLQGHSEPLQPIKKQRLNNGAEEAVNQAPQRAQGRAPVVQAGQVDKDGFRIPQLPKRLQKRNEKKVEEKVVQKKARKVEKKVVDQPLVVQDDFMKGFKDLQLSLINLAQSDNAAKIETPMMIQSNEISAAFYERLSLEYYSMILKENIDHLTKLSQKTETLLANHNVNPHMYNNFPMSQSVQLC